MVSTVTATPALIGPIPGGPELLMILLVLVGMLAVPIALFAAGVGVGWWLRGRNEEELTDPDQIDAAAGEVDRVDAATTASGSDGRDLADPDSNIPGTDK